MAKTQGFKTISVKGVLGKGTGSLNGTRESGVTRDRTASTNEACPDPTIKATGLGDDFWIHC